MSSTKNAAGGLEGAEALSTLINSGRMYAPMGCDGTTKPPEVVEIGGNHRAVIALLPVDKKSGMVYLRKDKSEPGGHCLAWDDLNKEESIPQAVRRIASEEGLDGFDPIGITSIECYPSLKQQYFRYTVLGLLAADSEASGGSSSSSPSAIHGGTSVVVECVTIDPSTKAVRAKLAKPNEGWVSLKSGSGIVTAKEAEQGSAQEQQSLKVSGAQEVLDKMRKEMEKKLGRGGATVQIMPTPLKPSSSSGNEAPATGDNKSPEDGENGGKKEEKEEAEEGESKGASTWIPGEQAINDAPSNIGQLLAAKDLGFFDQDAVDSISSLKRRVVAIPKAELPFASPYHVVNAGSIDPEIYHYFHTAMEAIKASTRAPSSEGGVEEKTVNAKQNEVSGGQEGDAVSSSSSQPGAERQQQQESEEPRLTKLIEINSALF
eukprot:jgi/Bigna1/143582/aug1.80_g18290